MKGKFLKRLVASASAVFLLLSTAAIPVFADSAKITTGTISFPDYKSEKGVEYKTDQKIELASNIVDINDMTAQKAIVVLVDSTLQAPKPPNTINPFDYALFSTSNSGQLNVQGHNIELTGKIHSNSYLSANYNEFTFIDTTQAGVFVRSGCESVNGLTLVSNIKEGDVSRFTTAAETPVAYKGKDIEDKSKTVSYHKIQIDDNTNKDTFYKNYIRKDKPGQNLMIDQPAGCEILLDSVTRKKIVITSGDFIVNDATYYFDCDVEFQTNVVVKGKGFIISTGDISFNGKKVDTSEGNLTIYSKKVNGQVSIRDQDTKNFNGIIYAPDSSFSMQGNDITINGSVIAKSINSFPSKLKLNFVTNDYVTPVEPPTSKLKFKVSEAITTLMNKFSVPKVPTLMGIWTYDSQVHGAKIDGTESFDLLDANKADSRNKINGIISGLDDMKGDKPISDSNLGDGLRKAYWVLNNKEYENLPKYVIVLSATVPNARTVLSSSGNMYFSKAAAGTEGTVVNRDYSDTVDSSNYEAFYGTDFGKGYKDNSIRGYVTECFRRGMYKNIRPIFVNCLPEEDVNFGDVDKVMEGLGEYFHDWAVASECLPKTIDGDEIKLGDDSLGCKHHFTGSEKMHIESTFDKISKRIYDDKNNIVGTGTIAVSGIHLDFKIPALSDEKKINITCTENPDWAPYKTGSVVGDDNRTGMYRLEYSGSGTGYILKKNDGHGNYNDFKISGIKIKGDSINFEPISSVKQEDSSIGDDVTFGDGCTLIVNATYYVNPNKSASAGDDMTTVEKPINFSPVSIKIVYEKTIN